MSAQHLRVFEHALHVTKYNTMLLICMYCCSKWDGHSCPHGHNCKCSESHIHGVTHPRPQSAADNSIYRGIKGQACTEPQLDWQPTFVNGDEGDQPNQLDRQPLLAPFDPYVQNAACLQPPVSGQQVQQPASITDQDMLDLL